MYSHPENVYSPKVGRLMCGFELEFELETVGSHVDRHDRIKRSNR
jgi:hypothetical protein